jgi:hypothetical protein
VHAAPRRPKCSAIVFPAASASAAASAEEDKQKNLKHELLHAQEEVKWIQSVPHARGEVDGGEGAEKRARQAALVGGERCGVRAIIRKPLEPVDFYGA